MSSNSSDIERIDISVKNSAYASGVDIAPQPLRVCCYGSSSSLTPEKYMNEARSLGYILAKRGHTCVNGAGSFGCMAAMNDGASIGNGHIVGVIHEMFVVDGSDWCVRDGGAHKVFTSPKERDGPIREMLVAGGDDLQERKKLLVQGADALVVLPGGPGTWDELWEMACARNIGLTNLPIVAVDVDGYYENFKQMLDRAYLDKLIKLKPEEIVHFVPTAEAAIRWVEAQGKAKLDGLQPKLKRRASVMKRSSFMDSPSIGSWFRRASSGGSDEVSDAEGNRRTSSLSLPGWALPFVAGVAIGATIGARSLLSRK